MRRKARVERTRTEVCDVIGTVDHDGQGDKVQLAQNLRKLLCRGLASRTPEGRVSVANVGFVNNSVRSELVVLPPLPLRIRDSKVNVADDGCREHENRESIIRR